MQVSAEILYILNTPVYEHLRRVSHFSEASFNAPAVSLYKT